jgi:hypothetical protein
MKGLVRMRREGKIDGDFPTYITSLLVTILRDGWIIAGPWSNAMVRIRADARGFDTRVGRCYWLVLRM